MGVSGEKDRVVGKIIGRDGSKELRGQSIERIMYMDMDIIAFYKRASLRETDSDPRVKIFPILSLSHSSR